MAAKRRLTLASMWAFEDIGIQEIQGEFKKANPELDCLCEYSKADDMLVMKGAFEGSSSKFASVLSDFVDEQKNKDLLDMPRIRQLDIPSMFDDEDGQTRIGTEKDCKEDLFTLVDDSNEELIPVSLNRVTKAWLSSNGGLGCFASNFHEILADIAVMTGTEISVIDEINGIQISGQNHGDVDDALAKLTRIERPLSFIRNPRVTNEIVAPDNERTCVRIQNYSDLNPVALRRILTDPNSYSNASLNQTFVTTLLAFDPNTHLFTMSEALLNPPKATNEPGKSRIWNDFTFQGIGKGDDFITMESIVEKDSANPQAMASGIAPPHPFLSVEKATRVNQWVVERAEMDNDDEIGLGFESEPNEVPSSLAPSTKKTPGIRTRKAISAVKSPAAPIPEPTPEPVKASSPGLKKGMPTRKRWKMQYESGTKDRDIPFLEDANQSSALASVPDSPHGSSMTARPRTPEIKPRLLINFDPTKYGLNKSPQHAAKSSWGSPASPKNSPENLLMAPNKQPAKPSELIDVFAPLTPGSTAPHLFMSFDQPALVPQKSNESDMANAEDPPTQQDMAVLNNTGKSSHGLLCLDFEKDAESNTYLAPALIPMAQNQSQDKESLPLQEKRLRDLKRSLCEKKKVSALATAPNLSRPPKDRRQVCMLLARQKLAELEKNLEPVESSDETSTREFHRTMNHKTARPSEKAKTKAEVKVKRQATLEDAWGISKQPVKKAPVDIPNKPEDVDDNAKDRKAVSESKNQNVQRLQRLKAEAETNQKSIKNIFEALKPPLEAAEYFTSPLTLEIQLGLILIPLRPKTYDESLISLGEWTKIFQPRNGLSAPTTKFSNRLTTTGSDVDHIVGLKTSKAEGKRHLFEQAYAEYNVSYEFHCRTTANQPFVIAIDEQGKHLIQKPATTVGAVNLHFPQQTWDASVVLGGGIEHIAGSDPELEEAVQHLVDNLWIQPERSLIRIFSRLPKGNKFVIEKVFMKRWTRHCHIRPDTATNGGGGGGAAAPAAAAADGVRKHPIPDKNVSPTAESPGSPTNETGPNDNQDIFLQITEIQDLLIGFSTSDSQALRARCAPLPEMLKKDRMWYEVSLVSPAIETILKSNANVEIGERTEDWRGTDLLGKDACLVDDNSSSNKNNNNHSSSSPSPLLGSVAAAIGSAGLGELFRLTKTVVEKIDGVGYFNCGPGVEAVRLATATGAGGATAACTGAGAGPLALTPSFTGKHPSLPLPPPPPSPPPPAAAAAPATSSTLVLNTEQQQLQHMLQIQQQQQQQLRLMGFDDTDSIMEGAVPFHGLLPDPIGVPRSVSVSSAKAMGHQEREELDYW